MAREKCDQFLWTWRRETAVKGIAATVVTFPMVLWCLYTWRPVPYDNVDRLGVV